MARLMKQYQEIIPKLKEAIGRDNLLSLPKMEKIVINMGVGKTIENKRRLECAVQDLTLISGQKPVITKARNSIAGFKIREGQNLGCKVTLRQARMFEFYDRLINIVIPRIRDFRGLNPKSFDGRGNYSMGITEQAVFPEIRDDKIDFAQGMDITIVVKNARSNQEAYALLELMGMPFAKPKTKSKKK